MTVTLLLFSVLSWWTKMLSNKFIKGFQLMTFFRWLRMTLITLPLPDSSRKIEGTLAHRVEWHARNLHVLFIGSDRAGVISISFCVKYLTVQKILTDKSEISQLIWIFRLIKNEGSYFLKYTEQDIPKQLKLSKV